MLPINKSRLRLKNNMQEIFLASGIGLLWGITNPFLEQGAKGVSGGDEAESADKRRCFLVRWALFFWRLFVNCKFFVPFALNQIGSLLFYYALGNSSILAVCVSRGRHHTGRPRGQLHQLHHDLHLRKSPQKDPNRLS